MTKRYHSKNILLFHGIGFAFFWKYWLTLIGTKDKSNPKLTFGLTKMGNMCSRTSSGFHMKLRSGRKNSLQQRRLIFTVLLMLCSANTGLWERGRGCFSFTTSVHITKLSFYKPTMHRTHYTFAIPSLRIFNRRTELPRRKEGELKTLPSKILVCPRLFCKNILCLYT